VGLVAKVNYKVVQQRKEKKTNRNVHEIFCVRPRPFTAIYTTKQSRLFFTQKDMSGMPTLMPDARTREECIR